MKNEEGQICCECEHHSHFADRDHHPYGATIIGHRYVKVGSWVICDDCKEDHDPTPFIKSHQRVSSARGGSMTGGDYCNECGPGHIQWTCRNHPHLIWSGKNIFGRSLFFFGSRKHNEWVRNGEGEMPEWESECSCPGSDLILDCEHARASRRTMEEA